MNKLRVSGLVITGFLALLLGLIVQEFYELAQTGYDIGLNKFTVTYLGICAFDVFVMIFLNYAISKRSLPGEIEKELRPLIKKAKSGRPLKNTGPYQFEIVILKKGVNVHHTQIRNSKLEFKYKFDKYDYLVKPEALYHIKPGWIRKLIDYTQGIDAAFMSVFRENVKEPLVYEASKVAPGTLKIIDESNALSEALKSEFRKALEGKKVIIILAFIVVIVVIGLVITGNLEIPGV